MKAFTAFLLFITLLTTSSTAFGQTAVCYYHAKESKVRKVPPPSAKQTANATQKLKTRQRNSARAGLQADFEKVTATAVNGGVNVEWTMKAEAGNVGFQVYKQTENGRELASSRLILGSLGRTTTLTLFDTSYSFFDESGQPGTSYEVVAVGAGGESASSESIEAVDGGGLVDSAFGGDLPVSSPNADSLVYTDARLKYAKQAVPEDLATQRWVADQPGAKINIRKEGFYRVRLAQLQAASPGVFTSGNIANWRLFRDGVEQTAITGSDAIGPYVEFYGRGIDTAESDTHVYYLLVDPSQAGLRAGQSRSSRVTPGGVSSNFVASSTLKKRGNYVSTILNNGENWWGDIFGATGNVNLPGNITVNLKGVVPSASNGMITVRLQGWVFGSGLSSTRVSLNNTVLGTINSPSFQAAYSGQLAIPANVLQEGNNTLKLEALNGGFDLFDSCTVEYTRTYAADQNSLVFTVPSQQSAVVNGFTSSKIRAFLLGPGDSLTHIGKLGVQSSAGTYSLSIPAGSHGTHTKLLAIEDSAIQSPTSITANTPSHHSTTPPTADMIIISHSDPTFMAAANVWKNYRAAQGFTVLVVDVADIMDEYNYGSFSTAAVTEFLQYQKIQAKPSQYVLLLGDGSYDPKNYSNLAAGSWSLIPTKMVNTIDIETGSDDALADFDGDALPEMAVGRIPARSASLITTIYNKTVAFESNAANQTPNRGVMFAYDRLKGWDFRQTSYNLGGTLSASVPKIYVPHGYEPPNGADPGPVDPSSKTNLIAAMNQNDPYMINYIGHGAQSAWADSGGFLSSSDLSQVTNQGLSVYVMLTCLNGYFINPGTASNPEDSIAEVLMRRTNGNGGGGPAAWASDGATTADVQEQMGIRFMQHVNAGDIPRMGDLIRDAKSVLAPGSDVRFSWVYFGDPMLKVR